MMMAKHTTSVCLGNRGYEAREFQLAPKVASLSWNVVDILGVHVIRNILSRIITIMGI
jgi:hypothetical protein